jgi:chitinase
VSDKANFALWIKELSAAFKPEGLLLTAAVSPSARVIDEAYDIPALSQYLDYVSVMTYDYHGQWDKVTGHLAPLKEHPEDADKTFNLVSNKHLMLCFTYKIIVIYAHISELREWL